MDYEKWVGGPWVLRTVGGGLTDMATGDELTFSLDTAKPPKISITGFYCPHSPPHDGGSFKNVSCTGSGEFAHGVTSRGGKRFTITSSSSGGSEVLESGPRKAAEATSYLLPTGSSSDSTTGGVCWTAEDGRSLTGHRGHRVHRAPKV